MASLLVSLAILVIVVGVVLYLINLLPIEEPWRRIARILIIVAAVLILLSRLLPLLSGGPLV